MNALPSLRAIHVGAAAIAIVACVPYALLKLVWLAGSSLGAETPEGAASLHDPRHTVGNAITLCMDFIVVVLALALTLRKGLTVPAPLVLFPMWVGTGLLAPIAVGLPLGLIGQAAVGGPPAPTDNELETWVYAIVYGGFIIQAAGLLTAFLLYARIRWTALFQIELAELPEEPRGSVRLRMLTDGAAAVGFVYAAVHVGWALAGGDMAAPPGFETVAQRMFLATVGVLVAAGAGATLLLARDGRVRQPRERTIVLIAIAWVGTAVAFGSGLAELGLAPPDRMALITSFTLAAGSLSGLIMGAAGSRRIAPVNGGAPRVSPGHFVRV